MNPTPEDIVKYTTQRYKLLMQFDYWCIPQEVRIDQYLEEGELFKIPGNMFCPGTWHKRVDAQVLHVFPPLPPVAPIDYRNAFTNALTDPPIPPKKRKKKDGNKQQS